MVTKIGERKTKIWKKDLEMYYMNNLSIVKKLSVVNQIFLIYVLIFD